MKPISNLRLFGLSVLLGVVFVLAVAGYNRWTRPTPVKTSKLVNEIWVAEQIQLDAVPTLKSQGFATLIDLRPDGEASDQPAAQAVGSAARANGMAFAYVPVPHGEIPDGAVSALGQAISAMPRPILLYCRSGRRAARTWSLAEASRPDGLAAAAILAAVNARGQSADDLQAEIARRIAGRAHTTGGRP